VTSLQVLEGDKVNLEALEKRLDFLEKAVACAPREFQDALLCDSNAEWLHAVVLGLAAESMILNCKTPVEFGAYLNRMALQHFGQDADAMFVVHQDETTRASLYDRMHAEEVVRRHPDAFPAGCLTESGRLDFSILFSVMPFSKASALISGCPRYSLEKYNEKTEYTGYSPPKDFIWAMYSRLMDRPENQALEKALDEYEKDGFKQMVRDPAGFEKRRQDLETRLKAAFDAVVGTIDGILDDPEEAEGYVAESHEVGPVQAELYGQPTHARYLFEKIVVYAKLDWLNPLNHLFGYTHYRLDHEGTAQMARIDDALRKVGYFDQMGMLKKQHCRS